MLFVRDLGGEKGMPSQAVVNQTWIFDVCVSTLFSWNYFLIADFLLSSDASSEMHEKCKYTIEKQVYLCQCLHLHALFKTFKYCIDKLFRQQIMLAFQPSTMSYIVFKQYKVPISVDRQCQILCHQPVNVDSIESGTFQFLGKIC